MEKVVISFSHSNYCLRSSGTEKFIRTISSCLNNKSICHINIFPCFISYSKEKKFYGINYNDKYYGIYEKEKVLSAVKYICYKKDLTIVAIHLEHLQYHDLNSVEKFIKEVKVKTYLFIHDYYMVCNKSIGNQKCLCLLKNADFSIGNCEKCEYFENRIRDKRLIDNFLESIGPWLQYIITPSNYVNDRMLKLFNTYQKKCLVRGHLCEDGKFQKNRKKDKIIRIAYLGSQSPSKGYNEWNMFVSSLKKDKRFEFYYLGSGQGQIDGVKNVYVSSIQQGENAMIEAIINNSIDVAFIWSNVPETYSYTMYEALTVGVPIISGNRSGNVCEYISATQKGWIFQSVSDCIYMLKDYDEFYKQILNMDDKTWFKYKINTDISMLIGENEDFSNVRFQKKTRRCAIRSYIYKLLILK